MTMNPSRRLFKRCQTNLVLNKGPKPTNTPHHQNWIHYLTALIQTTLKSAAKKGFQFYQ